MYENPYLAASVIREYIRKNRDKFIMNKFEKCFNNTFDNSDTSKKPEPIIDINKNYEYIITSTNAADLFNNDDLIVSTFYNLPMENKNLLVFLFDHIIKILKLVNKTTKNHKSLSKVTV